MEVASMLAAEPFSDEPQCVCPVIAEFLRTYNDQIDNDRRQDLFGCAALVVDTRADARTERRRANQCLDWWLAQSAPKRPQLRRFLWMLPRGSAVRDIEIAHRTARWAAAQPECHAAALELVEQMAGRARIGVDAIAADVQPTIAADAQPLDTPDVQPADAADQPLAVA